MKRNHRVNTSTLPPLTPGIQYGTVGEFQADQQKRIAELCARLAGVERRYNGQQKRIAAQDAFIDALKSENDDARKRLRFLENAAKLEAGQR